MYTDTWWFTLVHVTAWLLCTCACRMGRYICHEHDSTRNMQLGGGNVGREGTLLGDVYTCTMKIDMPSPLSSVTIGLQHLYHFMLWWTVHCYVLHTTLHLLYPQHLVNLIGKFVLLMGSTCLPVLLVWSSTTHIYSSITCVQLHSWSFIGSLLCHC